MSAMPDIAVVAVDWGTTNMRVWSVDRDGQVIQGAKSADGMGSTAREEFPNIMDAHLAALGASQSVPVIICGMAGSRQGWQEAPYLDLPTKLDGLAPEAISVDGVDRDIRILPGIAKRQTDNPDVMRSEETQLLGLVDAGLQSGMVCMPGTHAKWVSLEDGIATDFRTAMTGELYHVIATQSVLRHAVERHDPDATSGAFADAVRQSLADPAAALSRLFALRAATLLSGAGAQESADRLSGLLIGLDVATSIDNVTKQAVTLVGGNALGKAYEKALSLAGADVRQVDGDLLSLAGLVVAAKQLWPDRFEASLAEHKAERA